MAFDRSIRQHFLQSHGCHTVSQVPPTHRGRSRLHYKPPARSFHLSSATPVHRPCRAERIYRRRPMAMPGLSPPPGVRRLPSLRTLPTSVDCVLSIASPEHFWPRLRYSPLRLKTAAVFGSIDCSLRLHSASSTPPSLRFGGMGLHSGCTRKLSLATTFRLSPTPLLRHGVGPPPFHRQPETSACYSGPSMPCRRSPSSGRRKPSISALHPTHRGSCHCHSVLRLPFICCLRRWPQPQAPRCAARRCTDSTSAVGQPLHSLRVCLRLRARAGRLTVCGASSSTESLSLRASATPAVCSNPM